MLAVSIIEGTNDIDVGAELGGVQEGDWVARTTVQSAVLNCLAESEPAEERREQAAEGDAEGEAVEVEGIEDEVAVVGIRVNPAEELGEEEGLGVEAIGVPEETAGDLVENEGPIRDR